MKAYVANAPKAPLELVDVPLGELGLYEVEIEVTHCAICHSDLHLIDDDWGISSFPLVPGHEIVGRVARMGAAVEGLAIGQVVGMGWQANACQLCRECVEGHPHLCTVGKERTCVGRTGGFAERVRGDHRFVFPLPEGLDPARAAPLFCAGLTVFSPLKRFVKRTGIRLGVVGLGGLGHLAVLFGQAMGAEVTVFDPVRSKEELAYELGARAFFLPSEIDRAQRATQGLDLVLVTTSASLDWGALLELVAIRGTLCLLGIPKGNLDVPTGPLLDGQKILTGSVVGSPEDMRHMLAFAARHGIHPLAETMPISQVNEALAKVRSGDARFRIILETAF